MQEIDELDKLLGNVSLDTMDEIIGRMEKMKITKKNDNDIINLINSMNSLTTIPNEKKLDKALIKIKNHKKKVARRYKSLMGKKQKITQKQLENAFMIMNKIKKDQEEFDFDIDSFDWGDDDKEMIGGKKKNKKKKIKKDKK